MQYSEIKTLKKQVGEMLKIYEASRNDDAMLIKIVCDGFGHDPFEKASSIERCRRWWQAAEKDKDGKIIRPAMYLPTDERVAKQRKMNIDEWRIAMGYPTQATAGKQTPSWRPPSSAMPFACKKCGRRICENGYCEDHKPKEQGASLFS